MADDPSRLDGLGDVMSGAGFPFRGGYTGRDPGPVAPGEVFSACGGAMLVDRDFFLKLGGFDERLFCYCEDVDFGYRMRLIGEPTIVVPAAVVRHVGSTASGGPRSTFAVFHGTRNRLWVYVKNTPPLLLGLTLPLHLLTGGTARGPGDADGGVVGDRARHDLEPAGPAPAPGGDQAIGVYSPAAAQSTSRAMKAPPRSIWTASTYSLGWWAWSMEPGPQMTVEKPACWNWPAASSSAAPVRAPAAPCRSIA